MRRHRLKSRADGSRATQKHKTHDAGRSFVGAQQANTSGGISSLPENVPPACTSRDLEVDPLLIVPSLVGGLQPNRRKDDVDGPMAHKRATGSGT